LTLAELNCMIFFSMRFLRSFFRCQILTLLFLSLCLLPPESYAEIGVTKRSGDLSITTPEGKLVTVSNTDQLPQIFSGSVIEVLSGNAEFSLSMDEFMTLVAGESVMNVLGGTKVWISVNNNGADTKINVLNGDLEVLLGETILAIRTGALLEALVTEGRASIQLSEGEGAILGLDGKEQSLSIGQSYDLGSILPAFID